MEGISQEKLDWMKEIGIKEFKEPMKYHFGIHHVYSEKYIKDTPLEVLKERYEKDKDLIKGRD